MFIYYCVFYGTRIVLYKNLIFATQEMKRLNNDIDRLRKCESEDEHLISPYQENIEITFSLFSEKIKKIYPFNYEKQKFIIPLGKLNFREKNIFCVDPLYSEVFDAPSYSENIIFIETNNYVDLDGFIVFIHENDEFTFLNNNKDYFAALTSMFTKEYILYELDDRKDKFNIFLAELYGYITGNYSLYEQFKKMIEDTEIILKKQREIINDMKK